MQAREIFDRLVTLAGDAAFSFEEAVAKEGAGAAPGPRDACFHLRADSVATVMAYLRDDPALRFDFLQNLTAVDWIKRDVIEVVYHLFSYPHRHAICVKVDLPRGAPRVPTVVSVWPTANWLEREQYDLLGVLFEGHPDLRRLLMPDDWVGHPMRKDFREPKSYRGMLTTRPSPMDLLQTYDRAHVVKPKPPTGDPAVSPTKPEGTS
jgi:NADH-quinone oxidoreductase subunit C